MARRRRSAPAACADPDEVDGLNPIDPGARMLARALGEAKQSLSLYSGAIGATRRRILDQREAGEGREVAVLPWEGPPPTGAFDAVGIWPRAHLGKDFVERSFAEARAALAPGGRAWLAVRKQKGAKSLVEAAEEMGAEAQRVERRSGYSLYSLEFERGRGETESQAAWERSYRISDPRLGDLKLRALPGCFSRRTLDKGSAALLGALAELGADKAWRGRRVADLGAGWGALGLVAAAGGAERVDAFETNLLAAGCLEHNAQIHGLVERVRVHRLEAARAAEASLATTRGRVWDLVLSNPPTHADPQALRRFFAPLRERVVDGGEAWVVINREGPAVEALRSAGFVVRVLEHEGFLILWGTRSKQAEREAQSELDPKNW